MLMPSSITIRSQRATRVGRWGCASTVVHLPELYDYLLSIENAAGFLLPFDEPCLFDIDWKKGAT